MRSYEDLAFKLRLMIKHHEMMHDKPFKDTDLNIFLKYFHITLDEYNKILIGDKNISKDMYNKMIEILIQIQKP